MLFAIAAFVTAVVVHECAHGWMAYRLGDTTAKQAGRLTLNPLRHVDPVGTVLVPLLLLIARSPVIFGWAKPVPINIRNFAKPKEGLLLTGIAGPLANLLLAVAAGALLKMRIIPFAGIHYFLFYLVLINIVLAVFNLIPIPPLDGSNIVIGLLPNSLARSYARLQPYGFIILCILIYFGVLGKVVWPLVGFLTKFLIG